MEVILNNVRKVLAIEMLEYEDANYLAYNAKKRSEEKMRLLQEALKMATEME